MQAEVVEGRSYQQTMRAWWLKARGNTINTRLLSDLAVVVSSDSGEPLAILCIFLVANADLAWLGFTIRNPDISKALAADALKLLVDVAEDEIKRRGYSIVYTSYDAPTLQQLVHDRGYYVGSTVKEYFKEL